MEPPTFSSCDELPEFKRNVPVVSDSSRLGVLLDQKRQHTLAKHRKSGWLQTLLSMSPSEEPFNSSVWASLHWEA